MVIKTAGLGDHFLKVYFIYLLMAFLVTAVMCRIPPLSKKPKAYFNGKEQDLEAKKAKAKDRPKENLLKRGANRAIKKGLVV